MSLKWIQKRFEKVRDSIQRSIQQGNRGANSAPAYESNRPATYDLSRAVFLHTLGGIYLIAFCSYYVQFEGLYGSEGIIPVAQQIRLSDGLRWTSFPTLVRWHSVFNTDAYAMCNLLCCSGIVLSALASAGFGCAPVMFGCWVSYLSLVTVGDTFLYFQWDSLLLETGFLAILFAPLWGRPIDASQPTQQPARVPLYMLRFLLFKLMLMSGVVKIMSNDRVWLQLTALNYHFASQPIPTPVAWYVRQLHPLLLQLGTAFTFIVEIPCPFLILVPFRSVRHGVAVVQGSLQVMIMLSGNYGFFNLLTLCLCVPLLDDAFWGPLLLVQTAARGKAKALQGVGEGGEDTPLLAPGKRAPGAWNGRAGMAGGMGGSFGMRGQMGEPGSGFGPSSTSNSGYIRDNTGYIMGNGAGYGGGGGGSGFVSAGMYGPTSGGATLRGYGGQEGGGYMGMGSMAGMGGAFGDGSSRRPSGDSMGRNSWPGGPGGGGGPRPPSMNERGVSLQALLGQSAPVQAAGTILNITNSVDSSKFWSKVVGRGALLSVACLAFFCMFKLDSDQTRHPIAVQVVGAGVEWANGRFIARRAWRGSVQYKKETGPLLRMYKTVVGETSTWVIGAEDKAVYFTHSDAVDPPVEGWRSASQAADPPPSVRLVWSDVKKPLPLLDRLHLTLAFTPHQLTSTLDAVLPLVFLVFGGGLAIAAGIDLSYTVVYGVLTTRRLLASPPERPQRRILALMQGWAPLLVLLVTCCLAVVLLLAHISVMADLAPSLSSSLLQTSASSSAIAAPSKQVALLSEGDSPPARGGSGGLSGWSYEALEPFAICNGYGLFRSMTGVGPSVLDDHGKVVAQVARPELIIEVSNGADCDDPTVQQDDDKKCHWLPYEFHYKPGNTARAPPWVEPHMPRLDWQMWFAALGYDWEATGWLPTLLQKLAMQTEAVEELVGKHGVPFKTVLPTYMRVRKFLYDFTVRFETTEVMYEEPKGEATDLMRVCSKLGEEECRKEAKHCQLKAQGCVNRVSMKHTIVSEQSPGWWNRREPSSFSPVLKVHEFSRKGYLPAGDSLPNMPISYHGKYIQKPEELGQACEASCKLYKECVAYTYLPSRGVCYLKTVSYPVRGLDCEQDCWYFGVVREHIRLKDTFVDTPSRERFVLMAVAFAILLLLWQAPLLEAIQVWWNQRKAEPREARGGEVHAKVDVWKQFRASAFAVSALALLLWTVYYTAHHLGQVFVPYVLGAGTGMMLSCYLFHVETNLEQTPRYSPACDIGGLISCSKVALSPFSRLFFSTQNSLLGILYFLVLIVMALCFELSPDSYWILLLTSGLVLVGMFVSLYLLYVQLAVLCNICPVCLAIHIINFSLLCLSIYITHMQRAFLEYDTYFLSAMAHPVKSTHGD